MVGTLVNVGTIVGCLIGTLLQLDRRVASLTRHTEEYVTEIQIPIREETT